MKTHIFSRVLTLFLLLMTLSACASAIEIKLYDEGELRQTITSGSAEIPDWEIRNGKALYSWVNPKTGAYYGCHMLPVPTESMDIYAQWVPMEKVKPGKDAFQNGDFEGDIVYIRPSNGTVRVVAEADGNHVLEYRRYSPHASIQTFVGWEAGRKYHIHYRVKAPAVVSSYYNQMRGGDNITGTQTKTNEWVTVDDDFTVPSNASEAVNANSGWLSLYCNPINGSGSTVYYDDLSLIPYALVRYHAGGGSGAPEDTSLLSGTVEIPDVTPVRRGFIFAGWSLTEGGTTPVTSVEVNGSDIDLYAIWNPIGDQDVITYEYATERIGIADGTLSIIAPEEAAAYSGVSVYFANADGVMSGYTPFAAMTLTEGSASYTATGNRIFAPGATRLSIHFTASGKDDIVYWYNIPEKRQNKAETPLFTFYAVSDIHLQDYWTEMAVNRARMLNDIIANKPAFTVIAGDLVNHGTTEQYKVLDNYMKTNFNDAGRPAFIINGNHEFHISDKNSTEYDRDALLNSLATQIAANRAMGYEIRRDGDDLWYSAIIEGRKFIFMSTPSTPAKEQLATYVVSDRQLAFLREELAEAEKTGVPAFVISHVPLAGYVPNNNSVITNSAAVEEILNCYPGTTVITAHTHSNLSLDRLYVKTGGSDSLVFTHLNDGCSVWLEEGTSKNGIYEVNFSAGQVIEVYADKMIIKARKFADPCVYFGHGLYEVKLPGKNAMPKVSVSGGKPANGVTLSAVLDGVSEDPSRYHYEWLVNGKSVCNTPLYTLEASADMAGKYVVLRVSDEEGNYSYARSTDPFTAISVHYDANGGTGSVPADGLVLAGTPMQPDAFGASPKKDGFFFIGWSTDKNAVKPQTEVISDTDITLYAVYSNKAFFDFDATSCGWSPKETIKEYTLENSLLSYTDTGTDMYFTLSGISLSTDNHRYMRIKRRYDSGSGDGMFFSIKNGGGFSQAQRVPLDSGTMVAELDGMQVMEYDLTSLVGNYWKGTVNALRYDALGGAGTGSTDYIVFSENHGIYAVKLNAPLPVIGTMPEDGSVTLAEDVKTCTLENVSWVSSVPETGAYEFTAILAPQTGYEFANARDLLACVTVPGGRVTDAKIDETGKAVLRVSMDACLGTPKESKTEETLIDFGSAVENKLIVLAYYTENNRVGKVALLRNAVLVNGRLWIADMDGFTQVKAFVLDSAETLRPISDKTYTGTSTPLPQ